MNDRNALIELISSLRRSDGTWSWIDTASRPDLMDRLGEAIAAKIGGGTASEAPQAIVCWHDPDEVVLAHTVARVLSLPVSRFERDLGLLSLDPPLDSGIERVVVLGTSWSVTRPLGSVVALLNNQGIRIVSAVSLLGGEGRPAELAPETPFVVLGQP